MVHPQRRQRRASSESSSSSSSSDSSASSRSSDATGPTGATSAAAPAKITVERATIEPSVPRAWRFLDTEETCHFFNTEIVVSTNDVRRVDMDDASDIESSDDDEDDDDDDDADDDDGEHEPAEPEAEEVAADTLEQAVVHVDDAPRVLSPTHTAYEDIFGDFDDLYFPGIAKNAPNKLRMRRRTQHQEAAQVLSSFCKDLQTGNSYLFRKRSEFLRVCFQRALDLDREHDTKESAEMAKLASADSPGVQDPSIFQFQCSRLERPIDVTIPELYPRKWPHLPHRDPREWSNDLSAIIIFAQRVTELPEGSLLYEPIDTRVFVERCCDVLKQESIDVWSAELSHTPEPTETAVAVLVAMLSVAVRLQSFSLLFLVAETAVRVGKSTSIEQCRWGKELDAIVADCLQTLDRFLHKEALPATYPRALLSQWKLCAYQPSTSDAIATDGVFLYVYGRSGLLKIGTGRGSTMRDFVYEHNKRYCRSRDAERSWLCLIGDYLYCRNIVMPSSRVDRISTKNLHEVEELFFAPALKVPEQPTGSTGSTVYAMVTDGVDLLTVHSVDTQKLGEKKRIRSNRMKRASSSEAAKTLAAKSARRSTNAASSEASGGIQVGDRVVRGPDWKWGAQDGEKGCPGTVERISTWGGVKGCGVTVRWDKNQRVNTYRWGAEGCYDIVVVVEKPGGILVKKPLPDKAAGTSTSNEPVTPRHRFVVTRFGVSKLLSVVDLDREVTDSFLGISSKSVAATEKTEEDSKFLLTAVHEHTLGVSSSATAWMCDGGTAGCLGDNSGLRYRCERGCDFDLCEVCLTGTLIGKQPDLQIPVTVVGVQGSSSSVDGKPVEEETAEATPGEETHTPQASLPDDSEEPSPEEREATQVDDIFAFWCGMYSRRECEIALRRASHSTEDAVAWMSVSGDDLKKALILPYIESFMLESPANSSGLDPVLLVAGSFYVVDGKLCIVSPPGLYQGEKPKRSIHAADAAWFFSLKDGSLRNSKGSPTLLKSVPAGSPICTDISRRRILVFSGYLNCVEEYCIKTEDSNSTNEVRATVNSDLRTIGLRIYTFIRKAIDQRWAWRAFKKPMQGLQDWINQLQQESAITAAACIRENVKSDSTAAKARTRQIRKLRLRVEEFEKFECSEDRGYYVPYCVDFSKLGVRGLLIALNRSIQDLEVFGKDACLCLGQVTGIWRGFLGDCIASDVVLQLPEEWSSLVRSVVHGLEKVIFGRVNDDVGEFLEDPLVSVIVSACQDILLWGVDVGLFEGFDRCDLLVTCLTDLLADPVDSLPPNYFTLMHDSTGEVQVHSTQDCSVSFIRRVLALNTEATDGGIAALIYERSQVEALIKLLFKLSARESAVQNGTSPRQVVSGERIYSPVEKGLLALFNGCSIDLLASADASAGSTPRRRRLSSVISEESIFHTFAVSCLQTCEELVLLVGGQGRNGDDEILSRSVCGKLLPLVLAMACNGGRATLTVLKDPLLRLASLLSSPSPAIQSSRFTSTTTIIESSHPYSRNQGAMRKVVRIPGASCLHIEFDPRCSTTGEADFVFVTPGHAWFHSDRVPFGENGIGDAGGCFFGSRHTGNWPHHGRGISVWGDTATIMLCSTSQERQGASADDDGRRWGLKCHVRGVYLGAAASWRNDAFSATEHALSVLVQRQLSLSDRTLEHPLLMKAIIPVTAMRGLQSIRNPDHENLVRDIIDAKEEVLESCGVSLVQFYESNLLAQKRRQSPGTQSPSWRKALRLVLGILAAIGKTSVGELMTQDSVTSKSILQTISAVETWMIRRVQLLKECQFLQEDEAPPAQLIERLSTDVFRLKELCAMKDVSFFESDPKQSATELLRVISLERAPVAKRDLHDEVAREIIEKAQYALKYSMPSSSAESRPVMMNSKASSTLVLDYLTSAVSSDDVRNADGCLTSAIGYASNALNLVLGMQLRTDKCGILPQSPSTIGNVGSCWGEHVAEQLRLALPPDALSESHRISAWVSQVSQCIRDSGLPCWMRVAAMTDLIAVCATFRAHIRALTLREYIAATSELILDLEQGNAFAGSDRDSESSTLEELAWIGYRYGIDAMFADGDQEGAVSALRTMVGRLVSIDAASLKLASSVQSNSIDRVVKIGSAHVEDITQSPSVAATWLELCLGQIRGQDYGSTTSVCVASVRTIFAIGQYSSATLESSNIRLALEDPELLDRLLERIGILQSSIKLTGDENENKLKDCCVIILENDKSKSKIIDALETVDCETSNLVCLPKTLSQLDTGDDPPQAPIINVEGGGSDTVHRNVRCDGCNQSPIHGFRFKCFTCANYDLCGNCYANQSMHNLDHQFARLASPSGAGELLQPRSKVNGAVVPEASLVGSKQWMASVMRALLESYGYGVMCRGSSEDCLSRAKELSGAGFAVTVMEWPDVKDLEDYYDWESIVEAALEPGSARLSRRSSSAASPSTTIRKVDRCVLRQFNGKMRRATCRHKLVDPSFLLAELVGFTRYLVNRSEIQACMVPLVSQIMEGIKQLGTEVPLLTAADRALFHRTLGLTNVLGGFVETLRLGARVMTNDLEASKNRFGIVKQCADTRENVVVLWYPRHGLSDDEVDLESHHSPVHLNIVAEVDVVSVHPEVSASTSFFPAFASVLKSAHKLLKRTAHDLVQNPGHVAATELIVGWLRMFMTSMESLPSLLDSQASLGNGSGNMALLLFQLAKTSKSGASLQSLEGNRGVAWCAQQVMLNDCQFKLATRPIVSADVGQDSSCVFGPGANGQTDLTDYVFNLYAHSSRSELPQHSGRNKLLEYWEKNVIPAIESYVAGSFKSYEMDYFFAQLREPLREGNPAAAMKIAFTLCDGHVPSGCHYPDPDTDWSALQLADIEIGARYVISGGSTSSEQTDWPLEMQWTVGHTGVVRTVCPSGLVLMQLWNPRTSCLENWWFQVENLSTSSTAVNSSERSVDSYEHALADLVKIDLELLGVIARKCVFSMLRHSPDQFPLVSDRQATKTHFNIVDIVRMAAGAELGFEAKTIAGEADVGGRGIVSVGNAYGAKRVYDLMESLRFVLTKRFEHVPAAGQDAVQDEHKPLSPMNQAHKTKLAKSGKLSGGTSLSPLKTPSGQQATPSGEVAVSKYRFTLIEALVQELKRALESCASFSQQSAFTVSSDSPPKPLIVLKVPGASCMVISFAVHPVLMDLPAGSSLEFFRDERCTDRIFGFFGDKRGLNFLPPLVVEGDKCFVRASQAAYARYKFRVDPLTSDFGLAMWIGEELYQRMTSVTLASFELESILSSALNSITDYLTSGAISLPSCVKGVMCQLLTKVVNFAVNHSMSNSVPLSKLSALTRDLAVAYDHELSAQKGLFSLPTQQLGELLATVEEVSRLRGTTSISITAAWWPNLVRFATFTRVLTYKRESATSSDLLTRISCGRTPVDAVDEATRMLQEHDFLCERMILLQKVPRTKRLTELEVALSRFIQHLALEECGEADDQTVLSATEVVRSGVLGKVLHMPVDSNGETVGYAVVDVGRHDIISRLLLRLQKECFEFDGSATEEDLELSNKLDGLNEAVPTEADNEGGDIAPSVSDDTVWSCGVCTLENPAFEVECAACGSPMPIHASSGTSRRQRAQSTRPRNATSQDQGAVSGAREEENSSGWPCEACTLVNLWATVECAACGSERNPSLVEPSRDSGGDSTNASADDAPESKTSRHDLRGINLSDLLKVAVNQNVKQVTTFLVEQLTVGGRELHRQLVRLIDRELASKSTQVLSVGDGFVVKAAKHCGVDDPAIARRQQFYSALLDVSTQEPIRVYQWLRESGHDLNAETNHYTSVEGARASQARWTHQMDIQLVVLARQVGSRIGILSLMDMCPSHLCSSQAAEGSLLSGLESRDIRLRFALLKTLNKLSLEVLPMVNLRNQTDPNAFRTRLVAIHQLLFPAVKIRFFADAQDNANMAQSNLTDAAVKRPVVTLDRRRISGSRQPGEPLSLRDPKKSLFAATMTQLSRVKPSILRAKRPTGASDPFVAFIVVFSGENVVGEGGPYRQLFNDIASELLSEGNPLFVPTQNSSMKIGEYRDRFLPKPSSTTRAMLKMFEFVGVLMGCCIRTGVRLNLRLAPIIWKMLVKQSLTTIDLEHIDFSVCESLKFIETAASAESADPTSDTDVYFDSFTTALTDGSIVELKPGGLNEPVTKSSCKEYVSLVKAARFQECKPQVDAMLRGIGTIVPIHLLQLCTWLELQQWVCGSLAVDVNLLKRHTLYSSGMTPDKFPHLEMFWRVLDSFTEENKRRFINFAWGQDTLPADDAEFDRTHTRLLIKTPPVTAANQDSLLPKADTCFFNIELPAYSSEDIMREKLLLAITMCTSMDGDEQTGRMDLYFSTDALDDAHIE